MKRISFLKALLGIAVAPVAIAKAMEGREVVTPELDPSRIPVKTPNGYLWYNHEEVRVQQEFEDRLEQARFSGEPIIFKNGEVTVKEDSLSEKLLKHYGKMNINEMAKALSV